jgi:hypothetical protein
MEPTGTQGRCPSKQEIFLIIRLQENSSFHRAGGDKKERRVAESQAPLLQLNQFVPYLTGSPPSRQECRYPHYKTIYPRSLWEISAAAIPKMKEIRAIHPADCKEIEKWPIGWSSDLVSILAVVARLPPQVRLR